MEVFFIVLYIVSGIVAIAVDCFIANLFQGAAEQKGYSGKKYFWYCLLFGIAGWIYVSALPDLLSRGSRASFSSNFGNQTIQLNNDFDSNETESQHKWLCNNCGKMISRLPCRYCGSEK